MINSGEKGARMRLAEEQNELRAMEADDADPLSLWSIGTRQEESTTMIGRPTEREPKT